MNESQIWQIALIDEKEGYVNFIYQLSPNIEKNIIIRYDLDMFDNFDLKQGDKVKVTFSTKFNQGG